MSRRPLLPLAAATIVLGALAARADGQAAAPQATPAPAPTHTTPVKHHPKPIAPPPPLAPTPESGPAAFSAEKRLANMTTRLKLSTEQQAKMKPVLEETEAQVKEARAPGTKPQVARDKVKKILETADVRIRGILDGAQIEEWEKIKADVKTSGRTPFKATTLK
ncbi:MAG TPA: hypothetical protein VJ826_01665 [Candidatus Polarisedimenticolaceae bacterium]|nr:hypothetical protein [Candidatus Polarisedimenticolaceae bacterium]